MKLNEFFTVIASSNKALCTHGPSFLGHTRSTLLFLNCRNPGPENIKIFRKFKWNELEFPKRTEESEEPGPSEISVWCGPARPLVHH